MLPPERSTADLLAHSVLVANLGMQRGVPDPRAVMRLRRVLRRWQPDVVHSHMIHANLLSRITRLVAPMPVLVSSGHSTNEGANWRYLAYRLTHRLSDVTTNVSAAAVAEATRRGAAPKGSIRVMPNGIDVEPYAPSPERRERSRAALQLQDEFTWLAAGRLAEVKDYYSMLAAFVGLKPAARETVLLIAGTGPLEDRLRARIAALNLASSVRLLGLRSDMPDLLAGADGYVMSSRWEGLPIALLEAAAAGLPIVATDVGGNADVVQEGVSGVLVPSGEPDALARAMRKIMDMSAEERAEMGRRGRVRVIDTFSLARVVDRWIALYEEVSARKHGDPVDRPRA